MKLVKCILINILKLIVSIVIAYVLASALISFNTQTSFVEVMFGSNQDVTVFENAIKNLTSEIPYVGKFLNFIFSIDATLSINPSTVFEEFFSFVVFIPIMSLVLTPIFSMASKYTNSDKKLSGMNLICSGIDVLFNIFSMSVLAICSVAVILSFVRIFFDFLGRAVDSTAIYNTILLILGIAIIGIYCGVKYSIKHDILKFTTNIVIDFTLSLIVMTLAYTMATITIAGGKTFLTEGEFNGIGILSFVLCLGLVFVMHLKKKYK